MKKSRGIQKQVKANKKNKAMLADESANAGLFPAINLLHDPQGTVEKVFRRLRQSKQRFEVCIMYVSWLVDWCTMCFLLELIIVVLP